MLYVACGMFVFAVSYGKCADSLAEIPLTTYLRDFRERLLPRTAPSFPVNLTLQYP